MYLTGKSYPRKILCYEELAPPGIIHTVNTNLPDKDSLSPCDNYAHNYYYLITSQLRIFSEFASCSADGDETTMTGKIKVSK